MMIRRILALFGYIKIPREAVELSMLLEDECKLMATVLQTSEIARVHEAAHTLTEFLRSGRLISKRS